MTIRVVLGFSTVSPSKMYSYCRCVISAILPVFPDCYFFVILTQTALSCKCLKNLFIHPHKNINKKIIFFIFVPGDPHSGTV